MVSARDLEIGSEAAYAQAVKSRDEGGVPVGAALMRDGVVVSLGHNRRHQSRSNILHAETDCIERAGHTMDFAQTVMFTSLAPCLMCTGAVALFRIPTLVVLDTENTGDFTHGIPQLEAAGVEVIIHPHAKMIALMKAFQTDSQTRKLWLGDVGI